jgi:glycerol kinase
MPRHCFIGVDQGSSATKALALGDAGQVLFQTRIDLPAPFRDAERVEQDPGGILASVQKALAACVKAVSGVPILGVGLSCQRSSCLAWNEHTGEPLSPLISWRDTRGMELVQRLSDQAHAIFGLSGLPLTPYYSASKLRWLHANLPRTPDEAVFGTLSSFLIQRLTEGKRAFTDHTNAARTQLMNIHSLSWDPALLNAFGLSGVRLPEILPTAYAYGNARIAGQTVPLLACLGDQQAAMLGLGVLSKGDAGINLGTGGFLMLNTGASLVPAPGLMASMHYSNDREQHYVLEGSVNAAGDALAWARSNLGLFKDYAEVDDLCWKAAANVTAFVGLNGVGAPHWEADLSSAFHGLEVESTSADMVRAVVEGIAFFLMDIHEAMQQAGARPASFVLSGGLSSLSYLAQVQADLFNRDIRISSGTEASALGAAFLAGLQKGAWTADDIASMTAGGELVHGEPNPGLERRYRRWKELHRMTKELDTTV